MIYHILCRDNRDGAALRKRLRPSHLIYMINHVEKIVFGGPLVDENNASNGSVMIMEFNDDTELRRFLDSEPYNAGGLFSEVRISNMLQMVPQPYPEFLEDQYRKEIESHEYRL